jgi:hypothetical protein
MVLAFTWKFSRKDKKWNNPKDNMDDLAKLIDSCGYTYEPLDEEKRKYFGQEYSGGMRFCIGNLKRKQQTTDLFDELFDVKL